MPDKQIYKAIYKAKKDNMKRLFIIIALITICGIVHAQSSKPLTINFSVQEYLNNYVTQKVETWQERGRYESSSEYMERVNEQKRNALIDKLTDEAIVKLKQTLKQNMNKNQLHISDYDPDNQTFLIKTVQYGDFLLKVPVREAETFENNFTSTQITNPDFYFTEDGKVKLNQLTFTTASGTRYVYNSADPARFGKIKITTDFGEIKPVFDTEQDRKPQIAAAQTITIGKSDVAVNIPVTNIKNNKTFAVIIANEDYQRESQVIFAKNDADIFKEYCVKTLGLPEKNIRLVKNATLNNIRGEINWISQVAEAYHGEASIIFYYAGHGIPDESSRSAYLLPVDGYGSDVTTGYKLDDLYQRLGKLPAKTITVFMDACFSGAQRSGEMLASARGVAIRAIQGAPVGNMVVFSAAQGDETAYPYKEEGHGLFTYFLLKKLQETKGDVTLGELSSYITQQVRQHSIVVNNKSQTPTVTPSANMVNWQEIKLR